MNNESKIPANFYLLPDMDPPEMRWLLDRLSININDIKSIKAFEADEDSRFLISGNRLYKTDEIPDKLKKDLLIPVYKMSEFEDRLFKEDQNHPSAYYIRTPNDMVTAFEQMCKLGIEYQPVPYHFNTHEEPCFAVIKNKAYCCNTEENLTEISDVFSVDPKLHIASLHTTELLERQQANLEKLKENSLSSIPPIERTLPVCDEAAKRRALNIKDIPEYLLSRNFVNRLAKMHPLNMLHIPPEKLDRDICLNAIEEDSFLFVSIPPNLRTPEICEKVFEMVVKETDDPLYLRDIFKSIPHLDLKMELLEKYSDKVDVYSLLKSIPENKIDKETAEKAVSLSEYAIMDVLDEFKSEEMVAKVLAKDEYLLYNIPERYKTRDLCIDTITTSSDYEDGYRVLRGVPYPDIILDALKTEFKDIPVRDMIYYIPKEVMDEKIVAEIIKRDAACLPKIPFRLKNEEICLQAIKGVKDMKPLGAIPYEAMTEKVCNELVNKFPQALAYILPKDKRVPELCLTAVMRDEALKKFVPDSVCKGNRMNIYRFGLLVEKQESLNINQIKDIYSGKKVEIEHVVQKNQPPVKVHISYNAQSKALEYNHIPKQLNETTVSHRQKDNIEEKRKGIKM